MQRSRSNSRAAPTRCQPSRQGRRTTPYNMDRDEEVERELIDIDVELASPTPSQHIAMETHDDGFTASSSLARSSVVTSSGLPAVDSLGIGNFSPPRDRAEALQAIHELSGVEPEGLRSSLNDLFDPVPKSPPHSKAPSPQPIPSAQASPNVTELMNNLQQPSSSIQITAECASAYEARQPSPVYTGSVAGPSTMNSAQLAPAISNDYSTPRATPIQQPTVSNLRVAPSPSPVHPGMIFRAVRTPTFSGKGQQSAPPKSARASIDIPQSGEAQLVRSTTTTTQETESQLAFPTTTPRNESQLAFSATTQGGESQLALPPTSAPARTIQSPAAMGTQPMIVRVASRQGVTPSPLAVPSRASEVGTRTVLRATPTGTLFLAATPTPLHDQGHRKVEPVVPARSPDTSPLPDQGHRAVDQVGRPPQHAYPTPAPLHDQVHRTAGPGTPSGYPVPISLHDQGHRIGLGTPQQPVASANGTGSQAPVSVATSAEYHHQMIAAKSMRLTQCSTGSIANATCKAEATRDNYYIQPVASANGTGSQAQVSAGTSTERHHQMTSVNWMRPTQCSTGSIANATCTAEATRGHQYMQLNTSVNGTTFPAQAQAVIPGDHGAPACSVQPEHFSVRPNPATRQVQLTQAEPATVTASGNNSTAWYPVQTNNPTVAPNNSRVEVLPTGTGMNNRNQLEISPALLPAPVNANLQPAFNQTSQTTRATTPSANKENRYVPTTNPAVLGHAPQTAEIYDPYSAAEEEEQYTYFSVNPDGTYTELTPETVAQYAYTQDPPSGAVQQCPATAAKPGSRGSTANHASTGPSEAPANSRNGRRASKPEQCVQHSSTGNPASRAITGYSISAADCSSNTDGPKCPGYASPDS